MRAMTKETMKDRLRAFAVFTGIAIGGVAGFEMVIGGGFDPITPGIMFQADDPRGWYHRDNSAPFAEPYRPYTPSAYGVTPTSYEFSDGFGSEDAGAVLAGGAEVEPGGVNADIPSEAELRREIDALFEQGAATAEAEYDPVIEQPQEPDLGAAADETWDDAYAQASDDFEDYGAIEADAAEVATAELS